MLLENPLLMINTAEATNHYQGPLLQKILAKLHTLLALETMIQTKKKMTIGLIVKVIKNLGNGGI